MQYLCFEPEAEMAIQTVLAYYVEQPPMPVCTHVNLTN